MNEYAFFGRIDCIYIYLRGVISQFIFSSWQGCSVTTDTVSQLDILWHGGHPLGVDGAQVCIFKRTNEISLTALLKSSDSSALESEICLEVLGNLPDKPLEGEFSDKELGGKKKKKGGKKRGFFSLFFSFFPIARLLVWVVLI